MDPAVVIGALIGLAAGFALGHVIGERHREARASVAWAIIGGAFVLGVTVDAVGLALGLPWLAVGGIGLLGGSITGFKYGRGNLSRFP